MNGTLRAVVYVRVSDPHEKSPYGLDTQREGCLGYARERGYTVVGAIDEKQSGKLYRERPGLSEARRMIRGGDADVLLIYCLDRISRDQAHIYIIDEECRDAGARLEAVLDQFEDSPEGRLIFAAKAFMAEVEREKIVERTTRGKRARVQSGKLLAGPRPLYGYRWRNPEKTAYDIDPVNASVVRRIYESMLAGSPLRQIVRELMADEIPTPTGRQLWHPDVARRILRHPGYAGRAYGWAWRDTERRRLDFDTEQAIPLPEGTIPAIVSVEQWNAVQARLRYNQEHAPRRNQYPEEALMRGYVFCAGCGGKLYVERYKNPYKATSNRRRQLEANEPILDYACRVKHPDGTGCRATSIRAHMIDTAAWNIVRAFLDRPDIIQDELRRLHDNDPTEGDLVAVDRALQAVERQQANLGRAVAMLDTPDDAAPLVMQLRDLAERRRRLMEERDVIEARRVTWLEADSYLHDLGAWCAIVSERIARKETLTYDERRGLVALFGIEGRVYPKGSPERYVFTTRFSDSEAVIGGIVSPSSRGLCRP